VNDEGESAYTKAMKTRLRAGQGLYGPDVIGCINSGFSPVLFHDRRGFWWAGYFNDIAEVKEQMLYVTARGTKRIIRHEGRRVLRVKTKAVAARFFAALVAQRIEENREEQARAREAMKRLREAVDPSERLRAALDLEESVGFPSVL